jgi:hypothetical protein
MATLTLPKQQGPSMNKQVAIVITVLAATSLCLTSTARAAAADTSTIHSLYQACTATNNASNFGVCLGFIEGVGHMMHMTQLGKPGQSLTDIEWCSPDHLTREQTLQAFKNWHDAHPEQWDMPGVVGVMLALLSTWPCPKSSPPPAPSQSAPPH